MTPLRKWCLVFVALSMFHSCTFKISLSGKVWNLVETVTDDNLDGFLRFYADSTYTGRIGNSYRYGKWTLRNNQLALGMGDSALLLYAVVRFDPSGLVLRKFSEGAADTEGDLHYEPADASEDKAKDPYSIANNLWEIRARHKETDKEILQRVKNHLHCQLLYVQKAIDGDQEILSTGRFPGPIAFYGNGLALKPLEQVPDFWKQTFFDDLDAATAYQIIKDAFHEDITVPDTQKTFLIYKAIFSQLYSKARIK